MVSSKDGYLRLCCGQIPECKIPKVIIRVEITPKYFTMITSYNGCVHPKVLKLQKNNKKCGLIVYNNY